ncbi:diguanylate cyclase [Bosea sp. 117]|uniref:GGDEF domain-containing protein n=1 Tax=Bosea sp. 117 TaxID=1125973 RepID=UPI0004947EE9|nr:diguanylate cyclase [Bosea sp. 117]
MKATKSPPGSRSTGKRAASPPDVAEVYEHAPVALCVIDPALRYVAANDCFARLLERAAGDVVGRSVEECAPFAVDAVRQKLARAAAGLAVPPREFHHPESGRSFLIHTSVLRDGAGNVSGLSIALVDITERKQAESDLARADERSAFALESAGQWVWELDVPSNTVWRSPHWKKLLGYRRDESTADDEDLAWKIVHPADRARASRALARILSGGERQFEATYRIRHKDGRWRWVLSRGSVVEFAADGSPLRVLATSVDITRQKHVEEELAATVRQRRALESELIRANRRLTMLSEMDPLTELPNRRKFDTVLGREFRRTQRGRPSMALVMIDVDHFKNFNDLYGHPAGDECLCRVAEALRDTLRRSGDIVSRYGGEEFAAVLTDTDEVGAIEIAARMAGCVRALAIAHAGSPHGFVTVSIGLSTFMPDASDDPASSRNLMRAADKALYAAKEGGRSRLAIGRLASDSEIKVELVAGGGLGTDPGGVPDAAARSPVQ